MRMKTRMVNIRSNHTAPSFAKLSRLGSGEKLPLRARWLALGLVLGLASGLAAQSISVGGPHRPGYARPPLRILLTPAATPAAVPYTPAQIRHAYGFDQLSATGVGQKIAIVDAYGNQNIQSDLNTFCSQFGLKSTTVQVIGSNSGGRGNGWDLETSLDVQWAHVVAPDATIILSVAPTASNANLLAAVDAAVAQGAKVVSMSWGGTEWSTESAYDSHFNVANVSFVASAGDSGELTTLPEVEWPAVSPYVVGVGGTSLYLDANGNRIPGPSGLSETAWSSSGGGLSSYYGIPSWQQGWNLWANVRGVPDVSYVADPNTGLYVYCSTYSRRGSWLQVGGTSAGAPQWAALIALANQGRASGVSGNNDIYSTTVDGTPATINANNLLDISSGSNGSDPDDISAVGYDLVTGLGSPVAHGSGAGPGRFGASVKGLLRVVDTHISKRGGGRRHELHRERFGLGRFQRYSQLDGERLAGRRDLYIQSSCSQWFRFLHTVNYRGRHGW